MTVPQMPPPQRGDGGWWVPALSADGSPGWTWQPDPPSAASLLPAHLVPPVSDAPRPGARRRSESPSVLEPGLEVTFGPALLPPPPPGRRKPLPAGMVRVLPAPTVGGVSPAPGTTGTARRRRDLLLGVGGLAVAVCVGILAMATNDDPIVPAVQSVPVATPTPPPTPTQPPPFSTPQAPPVQVVPPEQPAAEQAPEQASEQPVAEEEAPAEAQPGEEGTAVGGTAAEVVQ
jgi:hypothetical protein